MPNWLKERKLCPKCDIPMTREYLDGTGGSTYTAWVCPRCGKEIRP